MIDVNLPHTQPTTSPRIGEFTERVLARLKPLTEGEEEIQNHIMEENTEGDQDERTQAIRLLKTGVCFVCLSVNECACVPGLLGVTVFVFFFSVEMVDDQRWTLLLFCCPGTAASPPSPLQSESQFCL